MYYLNILYTLSLELYTYLEKDQLQDLTFERNHHQFQHQQRTFMHLQNLLNLLRSKPTCIWTPNLKTKNGHWFSFYVGSGGKGLVLHRLLRSSMEFSLNLLCSYYHVCWLLLEKIYWHQFFLRCKLTSQEYKGTSL